MDGIPFQLLLMVRLQTSSTPAQPHDLGGLKGQPTTVAIRETDLRCRVVALVMIQHAAASACKCAQAGDAWIHEWFDGRVDVRLKTLLSYLRMGRHVKQCIADLDIHICISAPLGMPHYGTPHCIYPVLLLLRIEARSCQSHVRSGQLSCTTSPPLGRGAVKPNLVCVSDEKVVAVNCGDLKGMGLVEHVLRALD